MLKVIGSNNIDFNDFHRPFTWHNKYNNTKHIKKAIQRANAYSMASIKNVESVYA